MEKQVRCDNCSTYLGTLPAGHADFQAPSKGGIAYRGGIVGRIKYFCNDSCKSEWKNRNDNNSSSSSSSNADGNPEMARLEWEKEQAEKREAAEKKARRREKANELREENKPFSAFLVQHGEGVGIASGIVAMILFIFVTAKHKTGLNVTGWILMTILVGGWGYLGIKYLKEYFRK